MDTYRARHRLTDQTVIVTGASRGIGRDIAIRMAADGANVALLAKTVDPNPKIEGTLSETARAVLAAGGSPLSIACDIRDADAVQAAVSTVTETFGRIDIVVNNAGALDLRHTDALPPRSFNRLLAVNVEGPFALVHAALALLQESPNPHIVNISPPINLAPGWLGAHVGHTVGKYAESLLTLGWAAELASIPVAVNSVWPATTVASTGMVAALGAQRVTATARSTAIVADAVHALAGRTAAECSGNFFTDAEILAQEGVTDFSGYRLAPAEADLEPNFYLPDIPVPTVCGL